MYRAFAFGDLLKRNLQQIQIEEDQIYKQVTVRLWGKGVQLRNQVYGNEIKSNNRYVVKPGQFIISKIDARNGASGLIPDELDRAVITGDFLSFDINQDLILPEYLLWLSKTNWFVEQCLRASSGTTNRVRLNENKFLNISVEIPEITEQVEIVDLIKNAFSLTMSIEERLSEQQHLLNNLRNLVLENALQGKLVEQSPTDEPAAELLSKIEFENERLTKEKKIKREKVLPPISDQEKPFDLPLGWEWVRLGKLAYFINGDRGKNYPSKDEFVQSGIPFVNAGHLSDGNIDMSNMNFITREKYDSLASGKFENGDILYCLRGTLGKAAVVNIEEGAIASSLVVLKPYQGVNNSYLYKYLISPLGATMIRMHDNGTAQPNLASNNVREFLVPMPPSKEQFRIVNRINQLFELIEHLENQIENSQQNCRKLIESILQKYMIPEPCSKN